MTMHRIAIAVGTFVLMAALATHAEAGWGRYRVSTYYGTPSVPVVQETVVVSRPVIVAAAPVVVAPAPVTAYYSAPVTTYYGGPSLYVGPRGVVRAAYYAPAPRTYYYAPAPATYYYRGYPATVILP
jgi:hypothetical protein